MKTDFLFAQPSFASGVASVIDLEGFNFYNTSSSELEADTQALKADWTITGNDIKEALRQYDNQ